MNLLPKKSWHVASTVNREKVIKDERAHAIETELTLNKIFLKEREAKLEHLRTKAKLKYGLAQTKIEQPPQMQQSTLVQHSIEMHQVKVAPVPSPVMSVSRKSNNPNSLAYYLPASTAETERMARMQQERDPSPGARAEGETGMHHHVAQSMAFSNVTTSSRPRVQQEAQGHINLFADPETMGGMAPMAGLTRSQKAAQQRTQLESQFTTRLGQRGSDKSLREASPWYLERDKKKAASTRSESDTMDHIENKRKFDDPMTLFRTGEAKKK